MALDQRTTYRADIDGLRAVAVLAVLVHHLDPGFLSGGYVGVDVFFVISGYLITGIISREIAHGTFSFSAFYERRIRRLFPALFAMLAAVMVAGWFLQLPSDYASTSRAAVGTVLFSSNVIFWKTLGYFEGDSKLNPLLHTWSLGVEEQFYLVFPIFLLAVHRYAKRWLLPLLVTGAAVSLLLSALWIEEHPNPVFFLSPLRAWELLAGALLALRTVPVITGCAVRELLAVMGLAGILGAAWLLSPESTFPGLAALPPVLGSVLLIHVGTSGGSTISTWLSLRPAVVVGLMSYSLYLWHWPLIAFARNANGGASVAAYWPVLLIGSLALGALSYRMIEQPFRQSGGESVARRKLYAVTGLIGAMLGSVGAFGYLTDGVPWRLDERVVALDLAKQEKILFQECDSRIGSCVIGSPGVEPTVLLWGDSHMGALAPALDQVLRSEGRSALLAYTPTCPPLIDARISHQLRDCPASSRQVKEYLATHPSIDSVVMTAWWNRYFNGGVAVVDLCRTCSSTDLPEATLLARTIDWLASAGKVITVVTQVPTYDRQVPMGLAFASLGRRSFPYKDFVEAQREQEAFTNVLAKHAGRVRILEPAVPMCTPVCKVEQAGQVWYRDSNHLSTAGALALVPYLAANLQFPPRAEIRKAVDSPTNTAALPAPGVGQ